MLNDLFSIYTLLSLPPTPCSNTSRRKKQPRKAPSHSGPLTALARGTAPSAPFQEGQGLAEEFRCHASRLGTKPRTHLQEKEVSSPPWSPEAPLHAVTRRHWHPRDHGFSEGTGGRVLMSSGSSECERDRTGRGRNAWHWELRPGPLRATGGLPAGPAIRHKRPHGKQADGKPGQVPPLTFRGCLTTILFH